MRRKRNPYLPLFSATLALILPADRSIRSMIGSDARAVRAFGEAARGGAPSFSNALSAAVLAGASSAGFAVPWTLRSVIGTPLGGWLRVRVRRLGHVPYRAHGHHQRDRALHPSLARPPNRQPTTDRPAG